MDDWLEPTPQPGACLVPLAGRLARSPPARRLPHGPAHGLLHGAARRVSLRRRHFPHIWVPQGANFYRSFFGGFLGSPTQIDYRKTVGTLTLTSLLEDLGMGRGSQNWEDLKFQFASLPELLDLIDFFRPDHMLKETFGLFLANPLDRK